MPRHASYAAWASADYQAHQEGEARENLLCCVYTNVSFIGFHLKYFACFLRPIMKHDEVRLESAR